MKLYFLEPEVAGGHGEQTIYGTKESVIKKGVSGRVEFLHYEFEGWLGDDLLESMPAFIVSSRLGEELVKDGINDYRLERCLVTMSERFKELLPDCNLPSFSRLIPFGTIEVEGKSFKEWSGHHFSLSLKGELVVTLEALECLKKFSIENCEITILTHL